MHMDLHQNKYCYSIHIDLPLQMTKKKKDLPLHRKFNVIQSI